MSFIDWAIEKYYGLKNYNKDYDNYLEEDLNFSSQGNTSEAYESYRLERYVHAKKIAQKQAAKVIKEWRYSSRQMNNKVKNKITNYIRDLSDRQILILVEELAHYDHLGKFTKKFRESSRGFFYDSIIAEVYKFGSPLLQPLLNILQDETMYGEFSTELLRGYSFSDAEDYLNTLVSEVKHAYNQRNSIQDNSILVLGEEDNGGYAPNDNGPRPE